MKNWATANTYYCPNVVHILRFYTFLSWSSETTRNKFVVCNKDFRYILEIFYGAVIPFIYFQSSFILYAKKLLQLSLFFCARPQ